MVVIDNDGNVHIPKTNKHYATEMEFGDFLKEIRKKGNSIVLNDNIFKLVIDGESLIVEKPDIELYANLLLAETARDNSIGGEEFIADDEFSSFHKYLEREYSRYSKKVTGEVIGSSVGVTACLGTVYPFASYFSDGGILYAAAGAMIGVLLSLMAAEFSLILFGSDWKKYNYLKKIYQDSQANIENGSITIDNIFYNIKNCIINVNRLPEHLKKAYINTIKKLFNEYKNSIKERIGRKRLSSSLTDDDFKYITQINAIEDLMNMDILSVSEETPSFRKR